MPRTNLTKVGNLWIHPSKDGGKFLSGSINSLQLPKDEQVSILVFKNGFKKGSSRAPDFHIYISNNVPGQNEKDEEIPF